MADNALIQAGKKQIKTAGKDNRKQDAAAPANIKKEDKKKQKTEENVGERKQQVSGDGLAEKTKDIPAEKKDKKKKAVLEREYIIPLRREWLKVPKYKRANKAVKAIKEFLVRHMKIYDRDLRKVKIDIFLNNELRFRGIKKPWHKIRVRAVKYDDGIVEAKLVELPRHIEFELARKARKEAEMLKNEKESGERKEEEAEAPKIAEEKSAEKKTEEKEKEEASREAMKELEKQQAKQAKHTIGGAGKQKEPAIRRVALRK